MRLVRTVIRLTPYGVLALMTRVVASSNVTDVINLGGFVVASYVGIAVILLVHAGADAGRDQPGAVLPEDLAGAHLRLHLAVERRRDSAERRDPGQPARRRRRRLPTSPPASAPPSARTPAPVSTRQCWR
jgi:hypothetical protein